MIEQIGILTFDKGKIVRVESPSEVFNMDVHNKCMVVCSKLSIGGKVTVWCEKEIGNDVLLVEYTNKGDTTKGLKQYKGNTKWLTTENQMMLR